MIAKISGYLSFIGGIVLLVVGVFAWVTISSQLSAENITVSADAPFLANKKVSGPFSALAQSEAIKKHLHEMTKGKTYAELSGELMKVKKNNENPEKIKKLQSTVNTLATGNFLRASLFTSVLAFGVSLLSIGAGILFLIIGLAVLNFIKKNKSGSSSSDMVTES